MMEKSGGILSKTRKSDRYKNQRGCFRSQNILDILHSGKIFEKSDCYCKKDGLSNE